jgi:hypothetical protein
MVCVKRTTTNWAVLRDRAHEPLQFYWFMSVVKFYNIMLKSNGEALSRPGVLKADLSIHSRDPSSWTACRSSLLFKGCVVIS